MTRISSLFLSALVLSLGASAVPAGAGSDAPLGHLTTESQVEIESGGERITISDSTFPYVAAERIITGDSGRAVLTLKGGAISIAPASTAVIDRMEGGYQIALERGAVDVRLERPFAVRIVAGSLRIEPSSEGSEAAMIDATLSMNAEGVVTLENRARTLGVTAGDQGPNQIVAAGETYSFDASGLPPIAADSSGKEDSKDKKKLLVPLAIVGGVGGIAAGTAALIDDDDDDAPKTSNVR